MINNPLFGVSEGERRKENYKREFNDFVKNSPKQSAQSRTKRENLKRLAAA